MESPRFLIAKYVPDVFRNEPRNIGVVLWSPDAILARFLGEGAGSPGEVDESQIPPFVASPEVYKRWVRYWRREIAKDSIRPRGGAPAPRTSPTFLDALRETGPSNYVLSDLSMFAEPVPAAELPGALEYVFGAYVADVVTIPASLKLVPASSQLGRTPAEPPVKQQNTSVTYPAGKSVSLSETKLSEGKRNVPVATDRPRAETAAVKRKSSERRRLIDPATCERDYSHDETEFMKAMDLYKRGARRAFPTWSEVLDVLLALGYRRVTEPTPIGTLIEKMLAMRSKQKPAEGQESLATGIVHAEESRPPVEQLPTQSSRPEAKPGKPSG